MQPLMWGACSCDREKLLWPPEFTSGTHAVARSWPSGQLSAVLARGGYRPEAVSRIRLTCARSRAGS